MSSHVTYFPSLHTWMVNNFHIKVLWAFLAFSINMCPFQNRDLWCHVTNYPIINIVKYKDETLCVVCSLFCFFIARIVCFKRQLQLCWTVPVVYLLAKSNSASLLWYYCYLLCVWGWRGVYRNDKQVCVQVRQRKPWAGSSSDFLHSGADSSYNRPSRHVASPQTCLHSVLGWELAHYQTQSCEEERG